VRYVKDFARRLARASGLELRRFHPVSSPAAQLRAMLAAHQVNLVLDVGANTGQFGNELRRHVGYRGRIVSFEAMRAAHDELSRRAAKDALWEVAQRAALGARSGTATMNVSDNSVSSSILPMLPSHAGAAPESRYSGTESVRLEPLDSLAVDYVKADSVVFLKIDTQGYESEVLLGAPKTLSRAVGVQLELSLIPLYEGQKLMPEMIGHMEGSGFDLWGIAPTFAAPITGRMLQVDAIFFRRSAG
jgi:FkbM family methyltransferase